MLYFFHICIQAIKSINVKKHVCVCVCVCVGGCVWVGGWVGRVRVCSMDSQMAEWILKKLCRHDAWVPTTFFNQKMFLKCHTWWGKEEFKIAIQNRPSKL